MSELTEKNGEMVASLYWKKTIYRKHEKEMLKYLKNACNDDGIEE